MKLFKSTLAIKNFPYEYLVALILRSVDDFTSDLNARFEISNQLGICNGQFIEFAKRKLREFKAVNNEYSIPNLERWSGMKIVKIRVRDNGFTFLDEPIFTTNACYIHEQQR